MSKIISKAFNASKKIIRSVFKGSPNLITSADLNRQIEALKYQLDQLDDKTGFLSDIDVTYSLSAGTLSVGCTFSYIKFKGCSFSPSASSLNTNLTNSAPVAYLCLVAESETITYDNDSTHEIAGAKFSDGTSMPAANQVVYKNESFVLTHALSSLNNLVGILGVFQLSENTGNVLFKRNYITEGNSLSMGNEGVILEYNKSLSGAVNAGKSYDEAFSILENRANNIVTGWRFLLDSTGAENTVSFRVQNGVMYLNLPAQEISLTTNKIGQVTYTFGDFPLDIRDKIDNMFSSLNMQARNNFNSVGALSLSFIPYGEFGTFPVFSSYQAAEGELTEKYPRYGFAKISLIATYDTVGAFSGVFIGMYVDHFIQFSSDGKATFSAGPINWNLLQSPTAVVRVPRIFGVIPLPGKF